MSHSAWVRAVAIAAFALCLGVVVLGAYVRLSDAGLGCPDWPGCYGHLTPAGAAADERTASAPMAGRPLEIGKAWREMLHRYAAGTLGTLIVCLTAMAIAWRRERIVPAWFVVTLLGIVLLQGALGMLTVTRLLKPLFVSLHLLFGFTTLSLLWWLVLTLRQPRRAVSGTSGAVNTREVAHTVTVARRLALLGLVAIGLQITLGGWTSSNYAATACPDVPTCQASWWPQADFRSAFMPWESQAANPQLNYDGGVLNNPARVAIHLSHRLGAVVASLSLLAAAVAALRLGGSASVPALGLVMLLALQLTIGVSMVLRGFPLWLATAHNAGAALLLLATLALNRSLWPRSAPVTFTR